MAENKDEDPSTETSHEQQQMAERIKDSARQIWLAGLGAYTKAEEDAGRFFERLVKEGEDIEERTRGVVNRQVKAVEDSVDGVRERASGTWNRLESVFDERVSKALDRLGIPAPGRVRDLEHQVQHLQDEVEKLRRELEQQRGD
ncbi:MULTISPECIES: phasin family protein [Gammaproteobacteria]|jgi:poly(hydroxyalkanoate) granule-associated protein|uniref:Poly(Hydroxyalkanoate) granule-associated protein n=1 Tax=Vreelandella halophila TaxID=86177 RepID=A0A9X4YCK0_9GAMM|nr:MULTISPECIES: phasin family protein [Gammaproteobacteria]KAA8984495.1 phasin family protein [Halospina sp. K52047b]MYL26748.1 poly(hydroxyalkanoate) granule-associated protein [Halomonas utahensis]MYL75565.1 poly(hydroxyalkanoate) granule-associated protein [Halomonas sp. 22501_18_FS]